MNVHVLFAIFRRNFISYFSNPTGYVFICVFVLLSSFAAFWPNEFFNANLANLDQLNKWLPYILLVFIPAITMSIWAEERRLGTDELLLTIPAGDFEVVLGKYLAAVAIYSCSLVFSAVSNLAVLMWLGSPDKGLFLGNYFGYWMVGLAMLSIGMVASFLTANITVGFVLGAVFNTPLVFAAASDVVMKGDLANAVKRWSIESAFRDFGRGVVSLSSVCYFGLLTVVMLYISVVLIGRRHWWGGRDGHAMLGHYVGRAVALVAVAVSLTVVLTRYDWLRQDVTSEQLTALCPKTKELLKKLEPKDKVIIEAFVSPEMPDTFVQTRLDLLSTLREMEKMASDRIEVRIYETEPYSDAAQRAETQYDIKSQQVDVRTSGAMTAKDIYLGVAVLSGPDKVVIPFFNKGIPIEYELIRSIATVGRSQDHRQKLGVVQTEADLDGGARRRFDPQNRAGGILGELRKQYEVEMINADRPIEKKYDVVLAVQPSSLTPPQMNNFIDLVKRGQPTAIFEDPMPVMGDFQGLTGTTDDPTPQDMGMGMFPGMQQPPRPKARNELNNLWNMLGVKFGGDEVIWDRYNPYKHMQHLPKEFVFANAQSGADEPFRKDNAITQGLQEMGFVLAGWVARGKDSGLTYTPLVFPSKESALIKKNDLRDVRGRLNLSQDSKRQARDKNQALAAWIKGRLKDDLPMHAGHDDAGHDDARREAGAAKGRGQDNAPPEINVVLVADADCLSSEFLMLRAAGPDSERELTFNFDNVTFVLNTLDFLAGDDRFIEIRSRRRQHRTLTEVEATSEKSVKEAEEERAKFQKKFDNEKTAAQKRFDDEIARIENSEAVSAIVRDQQIALAKGVEQKKLTTTLNRLGREFEQAVRQIDTEREQSIRKVRNLYKYVAVVLPPIFPLLIGVVVFFNRRAREREGVPEQRLRQPKAGG